MRQPKKSNRDWRTALRPAGAAWWKAGVWFWQQKSNRHARIHTHPYCTHLTKHCRTSWKNKVAVVRLEFGGEWLLEGPSWRNDSRPDLEWDAARGQAQGWGKEGRTLRHGWCSAVRKVSMVACGVAQPWLEVSLCSLLAGYFLFVFLSCFTSKVGMMTTTESCWGV